MSLRVVTSPAAAQGEAVSIQGHPVDDEVRVRPPTRSARTSPSPSSTDVADRWWNACAARGNDFSRQCNAAVAPHCVHCERDADDHPVEPSCVLHIAGFSQII
jgi:hypothetical protein